MLAIAPQLQSHMKSTQKLPNYQSSNLLFLGSDDYQQAVLCALSAENFSIKKLNTTLIIQAQDLQGNSIITKSSHFSVSAVTPSKKLVEVQLIEVNPNIEVHVVAPVVVEVKFRGNHIKNSPFYYTLWTWSRITTTILSSIIIRSRLSRKEVGE